MALDQQTELSRDEIDALLGRHETGVLSLACGDEPYATPISYGYDAAESTFYFRLAVDPGSEKGDLEDRAVSVVVYGQDEADDWHSVVASGRLEETTDEGIATDTLAGLKRVDIPLVDIFGKPPRDVAFEFYRLAPDELTGRTESTTEL